MSANRGDGVTPPPTSIEPTSESGLGALLRSGLSQARTLGGADPDWVGRVVEGVNDWNQRTVENATSRQETELRRLDLQLAASNEQQRLLIEKELQTGEQRQESYSDIIRSVVLLLVVVTVLVTPLVVMLAGRTTPQDFSQYMAPVTGIAGTVIGYWFSRQGTTSGRTAKRNPRAVPDPPSEAPKGAASPGG